MCSPNFFYKISFVYFLNIFGNAKVFNKDQNTPKNANSYKRLYFFKEIKTLCSYLNLVEAFVDCLKMKNTVRALLCEHRKSNRTSKCDWPIDVSICN